MGSFFMVELIVVRIAFASSADFGKYDCIFCPFCSKAFPVIARAKDRSNPVLADFKRSEV